MTEKEVIKKINNRDFQILNALSSGFFDEEGSIQNPPGTPYEITKFIDGEAEEPINRRDQNEVNKPYNNTEITGGELRELSNKGLVKRYKNHSYGLTNKGFKIIDRIKKQALENIDSFEINDEKQNVERKTIAQKVIDFAIPLKKEFAYKAFFWKQRAEHIKTPTPSLKSEKTIEQIVKAETLEACADEISSLIDDMEEKIHNTEKQNNT